MKKIQLLFFCIVFLTYGCTQKDEGFPGYVETNYVYVSTETAGLIQKLFKDKGDRVNPQEILGEIDDHDQAILVAAAKKELEIAQYQLSEATSEKDLFTKQAQRAQNLYESKMISDAAYEASIDRQHEAEVKYMVSEKNVDIASKKLLIEEQALKKKTLRSPIEGSVYDRFFLEGELAQAGTPVFALFDPREIKVIFYVPENELASFHIHKKIQIYHDNKYVTDASITYISSKAEFTPPFIFSSEYAKEISFRMEAKLDDISKIRPGQIIKVKLGVSQL